MGAKTPCPCSEGGKSILHREILGMESRPGWQDSPGWVLQLPSSPTAALVLLFHPRLGMLLRKILPRWMLLFFGVILSLGAVSSMQDPALGWLGFRAETSLLSSSGGVVQGAGCWPGPQRWMPRARR